MEKRQILWAIVFGSMLAITGCGDDGSSNGGSAGSGGSAGAAAVPARRRARFGRV